MQVFNLIKIFKTNKIVLYTFK